MNHRQQLILEYVNLADSVSTAELAQRFQVAPKTIQRDLIYLAQQNLLHRTHGGAASNKSLDLGRSFQRRQQLNSEAKKSIAEKAVDFVFADAVIGLDASSSSWNVAQCLPNQPCTVVTNSMHNIRLLSKKPHITTIATGGTYSEKYDAFYGSLSEHMLSRLKIDMTIFSCTGIVDGAIWESNAVNASFKRKMLANSKQKFLFADHSKFGRKDLIKICDLSEIDMLFTNCSPERDILKYCDEHFIKVNY